MSDVSTVNPDGSQVKIEAVYWRYMSVHAEDCDSIREAVSFLESGEEAGSLASVGVFVEGQPRRVESEWGIGRGETDEQMLSAYAQIGRRGQALARAAPLGRKP